MGATDGVGLTERHWCPLIWRIYVYAYAAADAVQAVVRIEMKDIAGEPWWPGVGDRFALATVSR